MRPKAVAAYFNLGLEKKKEVVTLVEFLLGQKSPAANFPHLPVQSKDVVVPKQLREQFAASDKKDDMSDCLVQGLAYLKWQENLLGEHNAIATAKLECSACG